MVAPCVLLIDYIPSSVPTANSSIITPLSVLMLNYWIHGHTPKPRRCHCQYVKAHHDSASLILPHVAQGYCSEGSGN